jgi:hypothetical protein
LQRSQINFNHEDINFFVKKPIKELRSVKMDSKIVKEIVKTLMESRFYFSLNLKERHDLVKYLLSTLALSF